MHDPHHGIRGRTISLLRRGLSLVVLFGALGATLPLAAEDERLEPVAVQLPWKHQFQFAGYYAAVEKGFYERAGLDVRLREIAPGVLPIEEVAAGRAQFGVARSEILLERLEGRPLVALAAVVQHSPTIVLTRADSGILRPGDLVGRRLVIGSRRNNAEVFAMLLAAGIDPDMIVSVEPMYDLQPLIRGQVDAVSAYVTAQPFQLLKRGVPFHILLPITYGIDFYGDCLFTSEQEIGANPERVRRFRDATLEGWRYAFEHTDEVIEVILDRYAADRPEVTRGFLAYEAQQMRRLVMPDLVEIGHMSRSRWEQVAQTFVRLGMAESGFNLEGFLYNPVAKRFDWSHWSLKVLGAVIVVLIALFPTFYYGRLRREIVQRQRAEATLRKSEERFRELAELLPEAVFESDLEVKLRFANRRAFELFGYTDEDLAKGLNGYDLIVPDERKRAVENLSERLGGRELGVVEYTGLRKDGSTFPILLHISPIIHGGQPVGIRGVIVDISERKRAEAERDRLEERIHRAQKLESVGRLAGGMAHDLNNLLTPVIGYGEMLLEDEAERGLSAEPLREIVNAGRRARDLVRQLLAFSRRQTLAFRTIDLNDILRNLHRLLRRTTREDIGISMDLTEALPLIRGDAGQLEQVIVDLAVNAQDAMPDGGEITFETVSVTLDRRFADGHEGIEPGTHVRLSVRDTGMGMDEETLDHLFEPFFSTRGMDRGGGLGLATVYGIVKQHGGEVVVDSEPGTGTVFQIYLPAAGAQR